MNEKENAKNKAEEELDNALSKLFKKNNISDPWEGDFDDFMSDPDNCLDFSK